MLYHRLRALCCRHWGIAPPVLDGMIARQEIAMRDVLELVRSLAADPVTMFGLTGYLVSEQEERNKEKERQRQEVNGFGRMLHTFPIKPKNPEEAAFLEKLKKQTAEAANKI